MADGRERNQGMRHDKCTGQHSPGRNPQDDRSTGGRPGQEGDKKGRQYDPSRGGDGGNYKERGQNEQSNRR